MSLLEITGLSHAYGDKVLYQNASLRLHKGDHMGIVGLNGAGKSTLIGILTGQILPDSGTVRWQPGIRLGYLDQYAAGDDAVTILESISAAFAPLAALEAEVQRLYEAYAAAGEAACLDRAAAGQARLEASDYYEADTRLARAAEGLGLAALGLDRPLGTLSGGQRAKVVLARLLLEEPDVLLLDEPTNFLDQAHVDWLAGWLAAFPGAFAVVSHDTAFLSRITGCIADVEAGAIRKYHGSYPEFLKQKAFLREDHLRRYASQQREIRRTEAYIRANIAGVNTRIAQGRRKRLERLDRVAAPAFAVKPVFRFAETPLSASRALAAEGLQIGYDAPLLPPLNLAMAAGEKLVITGFNGAGKSTLLKTLMGLLPPLRGSFAFAPAAAVGYYEQDLRWPDPGRTPLQLLADAYPAMTEKQRRAALAGCGVRADSVRQPVGTLSGGEQSKVKLCRLLLTPCSFLVLDEPTNHMDADAREELGRALAAFGGCVLLVSHDESFYREWAGRVLDIGSRSLSPRNGGAS